MTLHALCKPLCHPHPMGSQAPLRLASRAQPALGDARAGPPRFGVDCGLGPSDARPIGLFASPQGVDSMDSAGPVPTPSAFAPVHVGRMIANDHGGGRARLDLLEELSAIRAGALPLQRKLGRAGEPAPAGCTDHSSSPPPRGGGRSDRKPNGGAAVLPGRAGFKQRSPTRALVGVEEGEGGGQCGRNGEQRRRACTGGLPRRVAGLAGGPNCRPSHYCFHPPVSSPLHPRRGREGVSPRRRGGRRISG
jgi:hypothetical protein